MRPRRLRTPLCLAVPALALAAGCGAAGAASPAGPGPASAPAEASVVGGLPPDAVRLRDIAPGIAQEVRYAGFHNFLGRPVAGYQDAECWLTEPAARALARVQQRVAARGYALKAYDCFRPQRAVDDFVAWARDPADTTTRAEFYPRLDKAALIPGGYIAEHSGHSRGSTVDVTLIPAGAGVSPAWRPGDPLVDCVAPAGERFPDTSVDMGTGFDCFDPLAHTEADGLTPAQRDMRMLLVDAMAAEGFRVLPEEWWHYTLVDEPHPTTYYDAPVTAEPAAG